MGLGGARCVLGGRGGCSGFGGGLPCPLLVLRRMSVGLRECPWGPRGLLCSVWALEGPVGPGRGGLPLWALWGGGCGAFFVCTEEGLSVGLGMPPPAPCLLAEGAFGAFPAPCLCSAAGWDCYPVSWCCLTAPLTRLPFPLRCVGGLGACTVPSALW